MTKKRAAPPLSETESARKRRRPAKSCEPCRNRKVGCDQALPCGPCQRARTPIKCYYRPENNDESRSRDGSLTKTTSAQPSERSRSVAITAPNADGSSERSVPAGGYDGTEDLASRVRKLESLVRKYENERSLLPQVVDNRPKLLLRTNLEKTRMFGRSHWMYLAEILPTDIGAVDSRDADLEIRDPDLGNPEVMGLLGKLRDARQAFKSESAGSSRPFAEDFATSLPPQTICRDLLGCYFRTFQPIYRIVHRPSFMGDWDRYWQGPESNATPLHFRMKLALVLAIGSTFYNADDATDIQQKASNWVRLAQEWIAGPTEKATLNLDGLQVFCLLLLAKQTTRHSPGPTWISAGSLLTMAMTMGLHRDPGMFPSLTPMQADMRKRLWAATVELTVLTLVDSAVPVLLSAEDFDTPAPLNIDDEDLDQDTKEMPTAKPGLTHASLQIQLFESLSLRLEAARRLNGLKEDHSYEDAWKLGTRLRNSCRKMAAFFRDKALAGHHRSRDLTGFHRKFVDISFHRYILLLHQPFMIKSRDHPEFHLSRKMCVESAETMASYATDAASDRVACEANELYLLAGAGRGSFKGPYTLHVTLVLCLELFLQLQEHGPGHETGDRLDEMHKASREGLKSSLKTILRHSLEFIGAGSVSMKSYNFLGAVLAQIDAIEGGRNAKRAAYETIKMSLADCVRVYERSAARRLSMKSAELEHSNGAEAQPPSLSLDAMDAYMNWDISSLLNIPNWEGA